MRENLIQSKESNPSKSAVPQHFREIAQAIIVRRNARSAILPKAMLVDSVWDILLLLFVEHRESGGSSTARIATLLEQSESVTARWLSVLADQGLVQHLAQKSCQGWSLTTGSILKISQYIQEQCCC